MAIGGTQQYSTALGGHQRPSMAILGNGEAISRHQRQSELMTPDYLQHHLQPKSGERFAIRRRVPEGGDETRLVG
jgi:hypothetical protein